MGISQRARRSADSFVSGSLATRLLMRTALMLSGAALLAASYHATAESTAPRATLRLPFTAFMAQGASAGSLLALTELVSTLPAASTPTPITAASDAADGVSISPIEGPATPDGWPVPLGGTETQLQGWSELTGAVSLGRPAVPLPGASETARRLSAAAAEQLVGVASTLKPAQRRKLDGGAPSADTIALMSSADWAASGFRSLEPEPSDADLALDARWRDQALAPTAYLPTTSRSQLAPSGAFTMVPNAGGIAGVESGGEGGSYAMATQTVTAVGRLKGYPNVTAAGTATYTIPLWVPPGVAGMTPKLALTYSCCANHLMRVLVAGLIA